MIHKHGLGHPIFGLGQKKTLMWYIDWWDGPLLWEKIFETERAKNKPQCTLKDGKQTMKQTSASYACFNSK